jgi:hypothetical protein
LLLLNHSSFSSVPSDSDSTSKLDLRHEVIQYLNDLENGRRYESWSKDLRDFLRPVYPGQLRYVGKNTFTAIIPINPANPSHIQLFKTTGQAISRNVPMRFGFLFVTSAQSAPVPAPTDFSKSTLIRRFAVDQADLSDYIDVATVRAFSFVKDGADASSAMEWLSSYFESLPSGVAPTLEHLKKHFLQTYTEANWVSKSHDHRYMNQVLLFVMTCCQKQSTATSLHLHADVILLMLCLALIFLCMTFSCLVNAEFSNVQVQIRQIANRI